jgi:hypothetical protein
MLGLAVFGSVMAGRFASEFINRLTPVTKEVMPPDLIASLVDNPQALVNSDAYSGLNDFFGSLGNQGALMFTEVVESLRGGLSSSLSLVFWLSCLAIVLAFVANLFLKDRELRKKHRP